jgi:hypothetical protein
MSTRVNLVITDWSPAILAAGEVVYDRLRLTRNGPKWSKLDDDTRDHYCIAAKNAVFAFHNQASKCVEIEVDPL